MVETFIRDDMMTFLLKSTADAMNESDKSGFVEEGDVLLDDAKLIDYFGKLYAPQPKNFRFQSGDRMLIKELVSHVAGVVNAKGNNSGLSKFKTKKKNKNITRHTPLVDVNSKELESDLKKRVIRCMYAHQANYVFDIDLENNIREDIVNVHIKNGIVRGTIHCIICDKENKVHYSSGSNWPCWVMSNFTKHLQKVHHLKIQEVDKNLAEDVNDEHKSPEQKSPEHKSPEHKSPDHKSPEQKPDDSVVCLNTSVPIVRKASEKDINNIYTQLSNQITLMMSVVLKNSESQEKMYFKLNDDVTHPLTVALIAGDGNCLYGALTHQLENKRLKGKSHQSATSKLRNDVVKYILDNYSKFSKPLRDRVYEFKKAKDVESIDTECKLFVKYFLSKNGTWGGAETIHAVS